MYFSKIADGVYVSPDVALIHLQSINQSKRKTSYAKRVTQDQAALIHLQHMLMKIICRVIFYERLQSNSICQPSADLGRNVCPMHICSGNTTCCIFLLPPGSPGRHVSSCEAM